jgi:hypothetical protein
MTSAEPMVMMEQPVSLGLSLPTRGRKDDPGCGRTAANGQEIIMPLAAPGVPAKAMMRPGKFSSVEAFGGLRTSACLPPQPAASRT